MKQNTFCILAGIVGLIEVGAFWLSVQYLTPLLISVVFIAGIVLLYYAWRMITNRQVDERAALINQKAGIATFMVFWVIFIAFRLPAAGTPVPDLLPVRWVQALLCKEVRGVGNQ